MSPEEQNDLWQQALINRELTESCKRHLFYLPEPPYRFGQKVKCENCKGEMQATHVYRYIQGYIAAGGNPNDIVPGYTD